ncbi:hypothetical protein H5410_002283 [Solanum commersonii]|uniref:Ubiquitin-like protease family profile domain-containing protein n=1 Tax=Solanum commersonii TaxID=4109 RepID=A0A9J6B1G7_SOLCO|nr:hypothetical protein H5410_002283 [Solanum commersonii]
MDHPSFNIGISQLITPNNEQIFESEHPNLTEQRSKSLHATTLMANRTSTNRKSKTEVGSSSKANDAKTKKKRGRRVAPPISQPTLPMHIDVIFYYLRKKSKLRSMDQYRSTTCNCLFNTYIKNVYKRYYCSHADDTLSTQQHIARADVVSVYERSIKYVINDFSVPVALPWHLVDEVYIPINCDKEFHWVLAVIVLRNRLIRVYDSHLGTRNKSQYDEIKQLSSILPNYLHDSGFFDKIDIIDWATLDGYKDNKTGELLGPQDSDCRTYVAAFAEFLRDEIKVPSIPFRSEYLRSRYATLL